MRSVWRVSEWVVEQAEPEIPCVYCTLTSGTSAHVFAREFFLELDRANLPQAPACRKCNGRKTAIEHYATIVLPFAGTHAASVEHLEEVVPKLAKLDKLRTELAAGMTTAVVEVAPLQFALRQSLPIDFARINPLFEMITRGLIWRHWQYVLPPDCDVRALAINKGLVDRLLHTAKRGEGFVEREFGDGAGAVIVTKDEDCANWVMAGRSGPQAFWLRTGNG